MKAWVFVEGPADELGLEALWEGWRRRLRERGHGIKVIQLNGKSRFFKRFGRDAAEKLAANECDLVVGLPDLYPALPFEPTQFKHQNIADLREVQERLVLDGLRETQGMSVEESRRRIERLHASAFKHDFEMLLLAAREELRAVLETKDQLGNWRQPVEEQDFEWPPKRIVEDLFRTKTKRKRSYRDTTDAPLVLRRVKDLKRLLHTDSGQCKCPEFFRTLTWMGERLGIPCVV